MGTSKVGIVIQLRAISTQTNSNVKMRLTFCLLALVAIDAAPHSKIVLKNSNV